jgi:N utilization substance protein B
VARARSGEGGPAPDRRPLPLSRHDQRERALEVLYEAECKGVSPRAVLAELPLAPDPFTRELVLGVGEHQAEHDARITAHLRADWTLGRLPVLDRLILRLALEELGFQPDVPTAAVLDEAVELAKTFSTEDSGRFVNGILSAIVPELRPQGGGADDAS